MSPPPTNIDGTDITGASIDGQDVQEITLDGQTVFSAGVDLTNLTNAWSFDEGSGTLAADNFGTDDITLQTGKWITGSQFVGGTAVDFDGSFFGFVGDSLNVIQQNSDWSIEFWINVGNFSREVVFYHERTASDSERISVTVNNGAVGLQTVGLNSGRTSPVSISIPSGLFHLVIAWDSQQQKEFIYADTVEGSENDVVNVKFGTVASVDETTFSGIRFSNLGFEADVKMDRVRAFSERLSDARIAELFNDHPSR